ncbi:hypothetical protein B296_00013610 [Ensete ventricosum]|uniref:Uncharacterized protein n=1 Tax=Ensete ventricosum TaxID=4639 RepID=A0A426Y9D7_ENSVE|nr:hypothetical protein B296_00013610 [Ensete ventricosum]
MRSSAVNFFTRTPIRCIVAHAKKESRRFTACRFPCAALSYGSQVKASRVTYRVPVHRPSVNGRLVVSFRCLDRDINFPQYQQFPSISLGFKATVMSSTRNGDGE